MFQPEPSPYLQLPTGYAIPHGLPDYAFEETPLRLGDSRGAAAAAAAAVGADGPGSAAAAAAGGGGVLPMLYNVNGPPVFAGGSANSAGAGPAPSASGSFNFPIHATSPSTTAPTAASTVAVSAPSHHSSSLPLLVKMEPNAHDLVAQEAAARNYEPQFQVLGPLVGKKTPSTAIVDEYAKADPIYVQKTMVLPQTYSHYRPIQGDGNCGWRAIGFGYFETLIKGGSKARIEAEKQRLEALNAYIENVGGMSPMVFQDFVDETFALMDRLAGLVDNQEQADAVLLEAFNTADISNSIMYHLRLLAMSYLKGNSDTYGAFVTTDLGIEGYCQTVLQRHNVEIDHLGLILLVNVLLKPVNFVLEVAYLDRSPGTEVNTYRFPEEANAQPSSGLGPIIYLLFRPDHYDILYRPDPVNLQVHRAAISQSYEIGSAPVALHSFGAADLQPLALIPGFGTGPPGLGPLLDTTHTTPSPLATYSPSPVSPWAPPPFANPLQQAPPAPPPMPTPAPPQQTHPLRFSEYCQLPEYVENTTWREPTFQTSTFKNSHFNVAHYNNPNFQPEEYKPETEDHDSPPKGSGRKRGSV